MNLLIINYHYIDEPGRYQYPAIYPVTPEAFKKQLSIIGKHFRFVSGDDVLQAVSDNGSLPDQACLITFDDGLRCQFELALPILDELGIPALFFASGLPASRQTGLAVHKIHSVRARIEPRQLLDQFRSFALARNLVFDAEADAAQVRHIYLYDSFDAGLMKYYLNYKLTANLRDEFISEIFNELESDEAAWCRKTYIQQDNLIHLAERGYLGSHTYNHLPLAQCEEMDIYQEIELNQQALQQLTGHRTPFIAYPYGNDRTVSRSVAEQASACGHQVGFTMERALNTTLAQPLLLARIDTNDALGGKKPCMSIEGAELTCHPPFKARRERYVSESLIAAGVD